MDDWKVLCSAQNLHEAMWAITELRHQPLFGHGTFCTRPAGDRFEVLCSDPSAPAVQLDRELLADQIGGDDVADEMIARTDGMSADERFYVCAEPVNDSEDIFRVVRRSWSRV